MKPGGGVWDTSPPENFYNLRGSNIDIQLLLLPREEKISDYSGIQM